MHCPRLKHFRRINHNGTIGICGHMIDCPEFNTLENADKWAHALESKFANNQWPDNCIRCKDVEENGKESIRNHSVKRHEKLIEKKSDYLIIGGTLDNSCNSACLTCSSKLSTKIASLNKTPFFQDNYDAFKNLPQDRILQLDINGGEPSYSKNYQKIINDIPPNLNYLRINTNGHKVMPNIEKVLKEKIHVNVTLSLDGIGDVHNYVRWPVKWENYIKTVDLYLDIKKEYQNLTLDFWTTLSSINLNNLDEIIFYARSKEIAHSYAMLEKPEVLNVKNKNWLTKKYKGDIKQVAIGNNNDQELNEFLTRQEKIRKIHRIKELYS